jgi:hypothetical protein
MLALIAHTGVSVKFTFCGCLGEVTDRFLLPVACITSFSRREPGHLRYDASVPAPLDINLTQRLVALYNEYLNLVWICECCGLHKVRQS